ncbi:hypothetical protein BT93_C1202 [Corymbia citriodora subsp. variegata]|nr:hypothetical protein BT93_C1202 [Corymbia citriodora subsp. variegata]
MARKQDPFRRHVQSLDNDQWECNFCKKRYSGSTTRIKAHLAGAEGLEICGCELVPGEVRSEALRALKRRRWVKSSNNQGNVEEGPHLPVTMNHEDGWRETSLAAMPYPSF